MERKTPETKKHTAHKAKKQPTTSNNKKTRNKKAGKDIQNKALLQKRKTTKKTTKKLKNIETVTEGPIPAAFKINPSSNHCFQPQRHQV